MDIIIFGASRAGIVAKQILEKENRVLAFSDNAKNKWGTVLDGVQVISPESLIMEKYKQATVVIASQYYASINRQLASLQVENRKVFNYLGSYSDSQIIDAYELVDISTKPLFSECVYNKDTVELVQRDFSVNYECEPNSSALVEMMSGKKYVLMVAYIFPPIAGAGAQRTVKFVKYLRRFGYEPIVLTVGKSNYDISKDEQMLHDIPSDIQIIRVDNEWFVPESMDEAMQQEIFNLYAGIVQDEKWLDEYKEKIEKGDGLSLIPDNKIMWANQCLKVIEEKLNIEKISCVYTTGNPFSDFVIGYYLKQKYGIKWIQDYRDPWMCNEYYREKIYQKTKLFHGLEKRMEVKLVQCADAVVTVSPKIVDDFFDEYGKTKEELYCLTNGFDEEDFRDIELDKYKKFTICYNGSIYIDRSPIALLQVINDLIKESVIEKESIQWIFNGTIESSMMEKIKANDEFNVVKFNGYLSHKSSIQVAMSSNLLILFGGIGKASEYIYTGKVFEYLRMYVNILCFSSKDGILDELLQRTGCGISIEYEDIGRMKEYIKETYKDWKQGNLKYQGKILEIEKYERKNQTKMLADIFDSLLKE